MDLRELQAAYKAESRKVTDDKIHVGALIRTVLSEDDGLVFKNGRTEKPKRLIVIGVDRLQGICYGSILVNTKMNPSASYSSEYLASQYLLSAFTYPEFLDYDSYADCAVIFSIPISKLYKGEYFGNLTETDSAGIFSILETTATLSTKMKKRFGIKRK